MFGLIFGITFALCGLVAIMVGRSMSAKDREIASWPRAAGTITTSHTELVESTYRDHRGFYRTTTAPASIVKFSYSANGRELHGDQISRYAQAFTKDPLGRYPLGHAVQVHYDPNDPTKAYLEAPRSPAATIFGILGWGLVVLGIIAPLVERLL